jgi:hypothetical protein
MPWFRTSPSNDERAAVDRELETILRTAKPADLVVAWSGYGEKVLAAARVPAEELNHVLDWFSAVGNDTRDWFAALGLERETKEDCPKQVGHV